MARPALSALAVFDRLLPDATWNTWRLVLRSILGQTASLSPADRAVIAESTGNRPLPTRRVRESWLICGRRSGKSTFSAALAVAFACFTTHRLSRGERPLVQIIAADRGQAGVVLDYCAGMLEAVSLRKMIVRRTADCIDLTNRVRIQVNACSFKSTRGFTALLVIADEIAFWRTEEGSRNPDREVLNAIRPSLITSHGLLVCCSTPYSRTGTLYRAFERHYGQPSDVFVWKAPSLLMHPGLDADAIDAARKEDAAAAASEWDAEWRMDISALFDPDALQACVAVGVRERPPEKGVQYYAFCDPSGGSQDSMTLAIAHAEMDKATLDLVREIRAPFDPHAAVQEFADVLKMYRVNRVVGDAYSGMWCRSAFDAHHIRYDVSERAKSAVYLELLPAVNAGRCSLLDDRRLLGQFGGLERRTARGGRDSVDHGPGQHDDLANAAAGALLLTAVGLGRSILPPSFVTCLRAASVPSFNRMSCYLFSGPCPPEDDICDECIGNQSALVLWRRYRANGGGQDLRSWAADNLSLPEGLRAQAWRARCESDERAAGEAYDRFVSRQRGKWGLF